MPNELPGDRAHLMIENVIEKYSNADIAGRASIVS
jgi:hypothetical protein